MTLLQTRLSSPLRIGPFGRCVGSAFDEGSRGRIREVHVYHSNLGIHRIATLNDRGLSYSHGPSCDTCDCSMISLLEGETIDSVSGTCGVIIHSLTMTTSLGRRYGPYGYPSGYPFGFSGPILGFFGYCDNFLRGFGCYSDTFSKL
jgi:hypothetical protein